MRIENYQMLSVLGTSVTGTVHKARELNSNRTVGLKVIDLNVAGNELVARRLLRGAKCIAACAHPSIVQVLAVGDFDGKFYVAMEFTEGGSLADRLDVTRYSKRALNCSFVMFALAASKLNCSGFTKSLCSNRVMYLRAHS